MFFQFGHAQFTARSTWFICFFIHSRLGASSRAEPNQEDSRVCVCVCVYVVCVYQLQNRTATTAAAAVGISINRLAFVCL